MGRPRQVFEGIMEGKRWSVGRRLQQSALLISCVVRVVRRFSEGCCM